MANKGFTLLELLVVLVIISLVSAFVGPQLAGSLDKMNTKTTAKKIIAGLRYARSQAVSHKRPYLSVFDFDKNRLMIQEAKTQNQKSKIKIYDFPQGIHLEKVVLDQEEVDYGQCYISFYPQGNSSGGDIYLIDDQNRHYQIKIDFITGTSQLVD